MPPALNPTHLRYTILVLLAGTLFIPGIASSALAQQAEIEDLASHVARGIAASRKKKVAVADFRAVNGKSVPLGTWLADQFSVALAKAAPGLEIIDRARLKAAIEGRPLFREDSPTLDPETARILCHSVGAKIVVAGSIGPAERAVGLTLDSLDACHLEKLQSIKPTRGKTPLNQEMEALLPEPLESLLLPGGIWKAGKGGASDPSCIECSSPRFSDEAVERKVQGAVLMEVTVTTEGRVRDIRVLKSLGYGLDEIAVDTVRNWKLRPAVDPDGTQVPARTFIEVSFRLR
jgi:TonB family protein